MLSDSAISVTRLLVVAVIGGSCPVAQPWMGPGGLDLYPNPARKIKKAIKEKKKKKEKENKEKEMNDFYITDAI